MHINMDKDKKLANSDSMHIHMFKDKKLARKNRISIQKQKWIKYSSNNNGMIFINICSFLLFSLIYSIHKRQRCTLNITFIYFQHNYVHIGILFY